MTGESDNLVLTLLGDMRASLRRVEGKLDELVSRVGSVGRTSRKSMSGWQAFTATWLIIPREWMVSTGDSIASRRGLVSSTLERAYSISLTEASTLIVASPKPTRRPLTGAASR